MKARKQLDLGNSDFKNTIQGNHYYIDKSLFIREIINSQKAVVLLPRPRRFGKTLNMSMLYYFFDIRQPENEKLFTDLKIWQTADDIKGKRGKYPVIFLTFKDVKASTWQKCFSKIKSEIAGLYNKHNYLFESNLLSESEKAFFNEIVYQRGEEANYESSIKVMSDFLFRYYGERVVILIDEYDAPIQSGYKEYYQNVIDFMRNMMSGAFKDNTSLYKGAITGILRVSKESIFSGLNNVTVHTILDSRFSDLFGFTESEMQNILKDFEVKVDFDEVKKWYNGYKIGNVTGIYNPWSILNFALESENGFKPFWVNTSSDSLIKDRISEKDAKQTRAEILELINNGTIEKEIDENFVFPDFNTDRELLWSLLTFSGYLTVDQQIGRKTYRLKIPNYEIKTVFQDVIISWLNTQVKVQKRLLEETTNYLTNNEIHKFEKGFKKIIGDTFSYFDTDGEPENVYQSYVLGLLAIIGDDYIIRSNRESGEGRYDTSTSLSTGIMLIPHDKSKYGVVIEIKQISKGKRESQKGFVKRINETIGLAAAQIDENSYIKELVDHQIEKMVKLPIVFAGKEPFIFPIP